MIFGILHGKILVPPHLASDRAALAIVFGCFLQIYSKIATSSYKTSCYKQQEKNKSPYNGNKMSKGEWQNNGDQWDWVKRS